MKWSRPTSLLNFIYGLKIRKASQMRLFKFILLFLFVSSCTLYETNFSDEVPPSTRNLASIPSKEAHIVFDLDWTLVTPLKQGSEKPFLHTGRVFVVEGHPYLLKEGMVAILEASLLKGMKVSFFSGGKRSRNISLLKMIKLSNGKSLFDVAYKVLSFSDLSEVSPDPQLRFSERYKKDLSKIHPELENIIFIEDIPHFAKGQGQRQTAWLGETTFPKLDGKTIKESQDYWKSFNVEDRYLPQSIEQDWWQRRKAFLLAYEIEKANRDNFDTQEILDSLIKENFNEATAPSEIHNILMESKFYKDFLKARPCPKLF